MPSLSLWFTFFSSRQRFLSSLISLISVGEWAVMRSAFTALCGPRTTAHGCAGWGFVRRTKVAPWMATQSTPTATIPVVLAPQRQRLPPQHFLKSPYAEFADIPKPRNTSQFQWVRYSDESGPREGAGLSSLASSPYRHVGFPATSLKPENK